MHGNAKINEREIINPAQKLHKNWKCIKLETDIKSNSTRIIDMLSPIGKGQRGLIVAQPKKNIEFNYKLAYYTVEKIVN